MKIKINNQELDFTLENEKNLGDIFFQIVNWVQNAGFNIITIMADGKNLPIDEKKKWSQIKIEDINILEISATHISQLKAENLQTVHHYLELLDKSITTGNSNLFKELMFGFPFMVQSIKTHFLIDQTITECINKIEKLDPEKIHELSEKETKDISNLLHVAREKVEEVYNDLENPSHSLKALIHELETSEKEISEVSILLQSGKDREAMEKIVRFSDLTSRLFRILSFMGHYKLVSIDKLKIGGKTGEEFYSELNGILEELINAFNLGDYVLIGDLLEYEIAPRLEMLIALAREIQFS